MREDTSMQQLITFPLANYLFALPSQQIIKVVPMPSPTEGGLVAMDFVQLGPYSIKLLNLPTILDLSHKLKTDMSSIENGLTGGNPPFLMVLQAEAGTLFGVTLHAPPDLLEWPEDKLQAVPLSQREAGTFKWVSHVAPCDSSCSRKVLLMLDLLPLLSPPVAALKQTTVIASDSSNFFAIEPPLSFSQSAQKPLAIA